MAVWYDNVNWFIFYPHGGVEDGKVYLYECLVQKGRIEIGDFKRLPPLDNAIDAPNVLTGGSNNSSSWALDDFQRLSRYMKPNNMAVNCQGICYVRVFPMDTLGKPLGSPPGSQRFWLRVFDLFPLNRFGLTPKPIMTPRQELYMELAAGDPSIKVPGAGSSADVISDLERDRDDWKDLYESVKTKHDDTTFSWKVANVSTLNYSKEFGNGDLKWSMSLYSTGYAEANGKYASIFLVVGGNHVLYRKRSGWKVYAALKLTMKDQFNDKHVEKTGKFTFSFSPPLTWAHGWQEFIPLVELRDEKRGLLVNDTVIIEAKITVISKQN